MNPKPIRRSELLELAKTCPQSPGVYLMKDHSDAILYVGKAKSLRNRVTTYFQGTLHAHPRTERMVAQVEIFDTILTETESEALILENTLIKRHRPKYNIRLKDDKTYPFLKLKLNEPFARLDFTRKPTRDGAQYFGPFPNSTVARSIRELINKRLQLRDCADNQFRHRTRPCLQYQMGYCTAPCVGFVSQEQYQTQLQSLTRFLTGEDLTLEHELSTAMTEFAEAMDYERAATTRDQLQAIRLLRETQSIDDPSASQNRDIVGFARAGGLATGVLLQIRNGRLTNLTHTQIDQLDDEISDTEILRQWISSALEQQEKISSESSEKNGVLVPFLPDDAELLEQLFSIQFITKDQSDKKEDLQILQVAESNAKHALDRLLLHHTHHGLESLLALQELLHLPRLPVRIECFDNSNFQGHHPVASRVVFVDGSPEKTLYRRYKIRTVVGADDFASMKEIMSRRFSHTEEALPDLVVIDGGKGQLAQAIAVFQELGIENVPVVGLAKARTESNFQKSAVLSSSERVFLPNRLNPVLLKPHKAASKLLIHIRDEAHRFAIQFHRAQRGG